MELNYLSNQETSLNCVLVSCFIVFFLVIFAQKNWRKNGGDKVKKQIKENEKQIFVD